MLPGSYYDGTIKDEAQSLTEAIDPYEDKFHATYNGILSHWFPTSKGYLIDHQVMEKNLKPEYVVVRRAGGKRNPLLIVELKRPKKWDLPDEMGKKEINSDLTEYIEPRFKDTIYDTIYGLGGIGLRWVVYKKQKGKELEVVQDWNEDHYNDITSNTSFAAFQTLADLVYKMHLPVA
ncbi:hypothetical protein F5888DRAFT_1344121 [Russula emetica]|nr:hypothetical protein F5888DRAFT_1344121 [Russula emetica]